MSSADPRPQDTPVLVGSKDLADVLAYVIGADDITVVHEETLNRLFAALKGAANAPDPTTPAGRDDLHEPASVRWNVCPDCFGRHPGGAACPDVPHAPAGRDDLRDRIAWAICRYDWNHTLSANDCPGKHQRGEADAVLAELRPELDRLREERDLAVAHDRQPYPTAWAYEQACKALETQRERAEQAEDLLQVAHDTSNRSEAERARAVHRAEQAERERHEAAERVRDLCARMRSHPNTRKWADLVEHALDRPAEEGT